MGSNGLFLFMGGCLIAFMICPSAAKVQDDLQTMSERIAELREKEAEIQTAFSLPAWTPSEVPKNRSGSYRRQEDAIVAFQDIRKRIAYLERCINDYIDVIRNAPEGVVRGRERMVYLLERRYLDRCQWGIIAADLFQREPDYYEKVPAYLRKTHRLHNAACKSIWQLWTVKR